jgi:poly(3-hydroxybutyrate) depolymerase
MRAMTGYEFERLADEHKLIVVYPNGFENTITSCAKTNCQ